jgi:tetratricopeptide (TPR) repeat protein
MLASELIVRAWLDSKNYNKLGSCLRARLPSPDAYQGLATIEAEKGNFTAAEFLCWKALAIDPDHEQSLIALSGILARKQQYEGAKVILDELYQNGSKEVLAQVEQNLGFLMLEMGEIEEAIRYLSSSHAKAPAQSVWDGLGYANLKNGDLAEGFGIVAKSWNTPSSHMWALGIPEWDGSPSSLLGARVLVHHHQGYGDTIQFSRFVPKLLELGACTVVVVPQPLLTLFATSALAESVADINGPIPSADLHVPISLLPARLNIGLSDLPSTEFPYLPDYGSDTILSRDSRYKVGIIWRADGGGTGPNRSIPLEYFLPLTLLPNTSVYGLQFNGSEDILSLGATDLITDLSYSIRDFADLAARIAEMDVIVSADTAPLHLAGALGKQCIALLSFGYADWRWLGHDRKDNPWYPSMKVIRQSQKCDWSEVIDQAMELLGAS